MKMIKSSYSILLLAAILLISGCAQHSVFNDPDAQRDRRDKAIDELERSR